jgi:hypothetical protein
MFWTSDDVTYTAPGMSLWLAAEMACMIIVYCAPSVPKALKWKPKGLKDTSKRPANAPTQSGMNGAKARSNYKRIDETGIHLDTGLSRPEPAM